MSFLWPIMLPALLIIPLLILFYMLLQRRRRSAVEAHGGFGLLQNSTGHRTGLGRQVPMILLFAGLSVLLLALSRPQTVISLPRVEGTVILAFDVSGSMAANDLQPTRMQAAKIAARDFVQHRPPGVQIGVVAFSDSGLSVQMPTDDQDAVLTSINRLSPQRGTSVANGILAALNVLTASEEPTTHLYSNLTPVPTPAPTAMPAGSYAPSAIILLTDGENNELPDPIAAAQTAARRGVRIYTIGIGSAAGTDLHINGITVHTQLDEASLQQIAQITHAAYYNAQSAAQLLQIYDNLDPQLVLKPEKTEVTSLFAGASGLLLLAGGLVSLLWFGRVP